MYCDGSYRNKKCAAAYRWLDVKGNRITQGAELIRRGTDSYTSELCAAIFGLEQIPPDATHVTVLTDCLDVVNLWDGTKNWSSKNKIARWYEKDLLMMKEHEADIKFKWVKGHSGIRNNEAVDALAKELTRK